MTEKATMGVVLQMVQQNDEKHEAGHRRLRVDYRDLESRVMALERAYTDTVLDFTRTKTALEEKAKVPVDIGRLAGNWKVLLTLAGMLAANLAGSWFSTSPVRESQIELQKSFAIMQAQIEGGSKLQDTRTNAIKDSVDGLNRQMEMRRLEIQSLSNEIQQLRRGR